MKKLIFVMAMILVIGTGIQAQAAPVTFDYSGTFIWGSYAVGQDSFSGTVSYDTATGTGSLTLDTSFFDGSGNGIILNYGSGDFLYVSGLGDLTLDLFAPHFLYFYTDAANPPFGYAEGGGYATFIPTNAVPEPSTLLLLGSGLLGLVGYGRKRLKK